MSALAGRRIVVTRARLQAGRMVSQLEARGARTIVFPTIAIRPARDPRALDAAVRSLEDYAWIVFTSANAVTAFWDRMRVMGRATLPATVRVASIGPATTAELAIHDVAVGAQPDRLFMGAAIARAMDGLRGARVLLPRAEHAREETVDALCRAGAVVDDVVAYHTETESPDAGALDAIRERVDAITFTSPSAVRGFATLLGPESGAIARVTTLATIGPTTSVAVREAGWPEPLESAVATVEGVVSALEAHFALMAAAHGASR
jgi:uroporphyrinogen-III synthase